MNPFKGNNSVAFGTFPAGYLVPKHLHAPHLQRNPEPSKQPLPTLGPESLEHAILRVTSGAAVDTHAMWQGLNQDVTEDRKRRSHGGREGEDVRLCVDDRMGTPRA